MRRLRRPSSMTIYAAIWPFPCTSFQARLAAEPQTWQACCGGYWGLSQAAQCCRSNRLSLTASQKGWLKASGTGMSFGIVSLRTPPNPLPVHRVLAADEFDICRPTGCIGGERPPQGGDDFRRLPHTLAVQTQGTDNLGHIHLVRPQDRVHEGIVTRTPEAGAVAGKAAIADVRNRDAELLAQQNFEIAEHVAEAGLAGDCHRCPIWKRFFGGNGRSQTEPQSGDISPPEETARNECVEDRAQLVARVAGFVRDERIVRIEHLHKIAVHAIRIDRLLAGGHELAVFGEPFVASRLHFRRHSTRRPTGTRGAIKDFLAQSLQGHARVADHRLRRRVDLVDVELVDVAVDDGLLCRVGNAVAEAAG